VTAQAGTDPAGTDPARTAGTDPAGTDPAGTDPAGTDPAGTDPARTAGTARAGSERTVVDLVRHGEVFNPEKILYGRLPGFRLSGNGERQAKVAAEFLAGRDIAAVVASPLERARQTAAAIAAVHGLDVQIDPRLIESRNAFEGTRFEAGPVLLRHPRLWKLMVNPFRPSWGEPYDEIAERMLAAVEQWRDTCPGREVVLVSHQLPIWTARRALEGAHLWHRPDRRQCGLASVTSVVYEGRRLLGVDYAEPNGPTVSAAGNVGA
jgi:broad specificity phosphatase PhoE